MDKTDVQIINISSKYLSEREIKLLSKGLKFTPTPTKSNLQELNEDVLEFTRKLRLLEYFEGRDDTDESLVRNKSDWIPPKNRDQHLEEYVNLITNIPEDSSENKKIKHNLTKQEREALIVLSKDKNIVIKEADKGGTTVIMDSIYYKENIENMLCDTKYYKELESNPQKEILRNYKKLINKHKLCLTKKEHDYLINFECKQSNFYGLPKVHKCTDIKNGCSNAKSNYVTIEAPSDLKFRPIVAGPACETHRLSEFLDILLRPYTEHVISYVRDTMDFLSQLPSRTPEHTILVSFDVVSLYSNIPHELGIKAIEYWLKKYPQKLCGRINPEFIVDGIKFILENNTFCFNNKYYKQLQGTAMGTKCAPVYATLVLAYLEETLYTKVEDTFGMEFRSYFEENWKRFLDDCFLLFTRSETDLTELQRILNSLHPSIQFTFEANPTNLSFLDTMIIKKGEKLETDIYYKTTDSKQYLLYTSCHPKHTRNNIPYSLARRIRTIVSDDKTLNARMEELFHSLIKRGYPAAVIKDAILKASNLDRASILSMNKKDNNEVVPYVSTYNPNNPEIFKDIRTSLPVLYRSETMKKVVLNKSIIKSKRQPRNLKQILTCAKFTETEQNDNKVTRCGRSNCRLCPYLLEGPEFKFNGKIFRVNAPMSCDVKNVVYVIQCRGCNELYIGETNDLRKRMTVHRQQIRDESTRMIPLSGHIDVCSNSEPKFFVFPFYKANQTNAIQRKEREKLFIRTFSPKLNAI